MRTLLALIFTILAFNIARSFAAGACIEASMPVSVRAVEVVVSPASVRHELTP